MITNFNDSIFAFSPPQSQLTQQLDLTIGSGTQELLDLYRKQSSQELLSEAVKFADLFKFSQEQKLNDTNIKEDIISTPEFIEQLSQMTKKDNQNNESESPNQSQESVLSSSPHISKIKDFTDSQESLEIDNSKKFLFKNRMNVSILQYSKKYNHYNPKKPWKNVGDGFLNENKQLHLENYLNDFQNHCFKEFMIYPEENEYKNEYNDEAYHPRKRLRKSSVSTCKSSPRSSPEVDNSTSCVDTADDSSNSTMGYNDYQAQDLNNNYSDKEKFLKDRRERNRLAALRLRNKRKVEQQKLDIELQELEQENKKLKKQIRHFESEILKFKEWVKKA